MTKRQGGTARGDKSTKGRTRKAMDGEVLDLLKGTVIPQLNRYDEKLTVVVEQMARLNGRTGALEAQQVRLVDEIADLPCTQHAAALATLEERTGKPNPAQERELGTLAERTQTHRMLWTVVIGLVISILTSAVTMIMNSNLAEQLAVATRALQNIP